ncbi:MAG: carbohydrate porin [Dissulfurispiraceae bacterium]
MGRVWLVTALLFLAAALPLGIATPSFAQDEAAPLQDTTGFAEDPTAVADRTIRCPATANPHKLHFTCVGRPFDAIKETLTQDLAGYRTELMNLGITWTLSYTAQFVGNPSGGQSQGFTYAGTLEAMIAWDLHTLLGIPGLSFIIGSSYSSGQNLSEKYIGNVFTVQSAFTGGENVNLQEIYLQQQFSDGVITIALGRLAPASTFATLPVLNNYINGGINAVPGSLGINDSIFTSSPPGVEWGAQMLYDLTPTIQVATGIFNTNPYAASGNNNGVNFAFQQGNSGVLTVAQVSYLYNQDKGDAGLPGEYTIGGFYDSNKFSSLSFPADKVGGNYNLYAMFQQMVYRDGGPRSQKGLTVWGEVATSPKPSVSIMPYFLGGGLSYQGLISSRGKDIASIGAIHGNVSGYIPQRSGETVIESNYCVTLTPWLSITPDLQYVIMPGGSSTVRNAFVLGAQLAVTL